MANSVVYSGAMPVETVAQAVLRLGFRETAQVSMAAACRSLFSIEDRAELEVHPGMWRGLWLDSLVCAYGGRLIAQELGFGVPERVFLCSMFRNLGELVILKVVAGGVVRGELRTTPDEETLRRVADRLHTELGARYLAACRLPDYVVAAAARHHDAGVPFDAAHADLHVVRLTEGLCARIGIGPCPAGELGPLAEETAACLGLAPERLAFFALQLEELAGQLKEIA